MTIHPFDRRRDAASAPRTLCDQLYSVSTLFSFLIPSPATALAPALARGVLTTSSAANHVRVSDPAASVDGSAVPEQE